jgi:acyl carrier protein phosphodiesterase
LKNQIEIEKQKKEASQQQDLDRKNKKINDLMQEIDNKMIENQSRYDQLYDSKKELENNYKEKIKGMTVAHQDEMERRKQDYAEKMDADQQRFDDL